MVKETWEWLSRIRRIMSTKMKVKGRDCEFMLDGKLRGGKIVIETKSEYEVTCHSPYYRKVKLPKNKVKILNE